jgi:hypothetical protein
VREPRRRQGRHSRHVRSRGRLTIEAAVSFAPLTQPINSGDRAQERTAIVKRQATNIRLILPKDRRVCLPYPQLRSTARRSDFLRRPRGHFRPSAEIP